MCHLDSNWATQIVAGVIILCDLVGTYVLNRKCSLRQSRPQLIIYHYSSYIYATASDLPLV